MPDTDEIAEYEHIALKNQIARLKRLVKQGLKAMPVMTTKREAQWINNAEKLLRELDEEG